MILIEAFLIEPNCKMVRIRKVDQGLPEENRCLEILRLEDVNLGPACNAEKFHQVLTDFSTPKRRRVVFRIHRLGS